MILTGLQIEKEWRAGRIYIEPFDRTKLNPNSYNLTLANDLWVYQDRPLDMKKKNTLSRIDFNDGVLLKPNRVYLARTKERTKTDYYAPMIEGRSSVGRLGLFIHVTAGFGDVGFDGFWTLELHCVEPVVIYPNVEIAQIYFHTVDGEITKYGGDGRAKYNWNTGVQPSYMYREFNQGENNETQDN